MVFDPTQTFSIPYIPLFAVIVSVISVGAASSLWSSVALCIPAAVQPMLIFSAGRPLDAPWYVFAAALWVGGAWSFGRFVARSTQAISHLESERERTESTMAA